MKAYQTEEQSKTAHVIDQLAKFDYYDVKGKSYEELRHKLAVLRAMNVEDKSPHAGWF
ncbi:hypothetical protein [Virgibacillus sp. Bac332]|uniref:hypothetical protein n=1 Tax=Virgibacillus sp. Bac332 TaxID=2419842 RepID=UPI0013CEE645|nr:hypothetical protein [Virgibacillus sp. Bac332]